jgi:hypothetical protein
MAEILFLTVSQNDTCAFYRSAGVVKDLRRKTDDTITLVQSDRVPMDWSFLTQFDLIMYQRPFTKESLNICGYIKQCGIKLWLDYDDDLFALNPENPTYYIYNNPEIQANIKGMLQIADAVSVRCMQSSIRTYSSFLTPLMMLYSHVRSYHREQTMLFGEDQKLISSI